MSQKRRIVLSILALIAVAALLIAVIGLVHSCQNSEETPLGGGLILDLDAEPYEPSADLSTDGSNGIAIPGYGDVYFPAGKKDVQITLYNPEQNDCLFRFELYIDDRTEPIAATDLIEAGKAVQTVTLSESLDAGEYTLAIKVLPYTVEEHVPLNNALVRAKLYVVGQP